MGSRKLLAIAAFAVVGAAACVNGDAKIGDVEDALRDAGADDVQARCVANELEGEELSQEQLNDVAKAEDLSALAGKEVAGSDEDLRQLVRDILGQCLGQSPEDEDSEGQDGDSTSTTAEPDAGEGSSDSE